MAVNTYECLFLLDPTKVAGDVPAAAQQLHTIMERNQSEILASRQWDERRLAYPIKNHKKGLYYLIYFSTEAKNLINIERDFALNETILRVLVLKVDPKLRETMLAVARDEHAFALQSVPDEPGEHIEGESGIPSDDGRGPRRGGRRQTEPVESE